MAYCSYCGKKIEDDARFCSSCGKPVKVSTQSTTSDESSHCPSCGHLISALDVTCPACGYEVKKRSVSSGIKEFSEKLEQIDKKRDSLIRGIVRSFGGNSLSEKAEEKAQFIRSYPIPNTKNDVFELMYMAASSVNAKMLLHEQPQNNEMSIKDYTAQRHIVLAWNDKMEQAYQKAKVAFGNDPDFSKLQAVYDAKKAEIEAAGKKEKTNSRGLWIAVIALVLIVVIYFGYSYTRYRGKENELEALVIEIQQDIANGDYDAALIKANSLHMDLNWSTESKEHWDSERAALIKLIEEKKVESE